MNENTQDQPLTLTATSKDMLEHELNDAVLLMQGKAMTEGLRGILVIHEAPGRCTVALSHDVPFGLTREKQAW